VTSTTTCGNGRVQRKSLNDQLDRFDSMLDGLGEAIPEVIADSVRRAVGEAVRLAVEASVREVLGSPELLRAALARHAPASDPAPARREVPPRRMLRDLMRAAGGWSRLQMTSAAAGAIGVLSSAWSRSLDALRTVCARLRRFGRLAGKLPGTLAALAGGAWSFRRRGAIALAVGVACAFGVYHAGPAIGSAVSGLSSAALAAAGMVLLPLWRLVSGGEGRNAGS
jgi:hypothetical protein